MDATASLRGNKGSTLKLIMMKKKQSAILSLLFATVIILMVVALVAFRNKEDKAPEKQKSEKQFHPWYAPELPETMSFAGERVPLERWEVREYLDREILFDYYRMNNMLYMLKLANRYFPYIEERLKYHGVPDDFKYLCVAESNMQNAISRAGAVGFWQFMRGSAPGYGLEVGSNIDERYNVYKSTDAACKYLKQAYAKFGSWTAAAASYNCGQGGYNAAANFQGSTNYYDLLLPEETQRYIFRILAYKYLMSNAKQLGYNIDEDELYPPLKTRTIVISRSIPNLSSFAKQNGTTYKILKMLNPWMRSKELVVRGGKSYTIHLPAE